MSKIRYRVTGRVFVNGSYFEPAKGRPVYVMAAPGLAGSALVADPENAPPPAAASTPQADKKPKASP